MTWKTEWKPFAVLVGEVVVVGRAPSVSELEGFLASSGHGHEEVVA